MRRRNGSMRKTRRPRIIRIYGRRTAPRPGASPPPRANCFECNAMPQIPIIMPQLGESIAEATVVRLLVKPGDEVMSDQDVMEVETNKATMNVPTPCPGRIEKIMVKVDESYPVGAVLGYLEVSAEVAARLGLDKP